MVVILPYCIKAKRCEHNALGYWSGLALCLTKVRSSRARCPATALILLSYSYYFFSFSFGCDRYVENDDECCNRTFLDHILPTLWKMLSIFTVSSGCECYRKRVLMPQTRLFYPTHNIAKDKSSLPTVKVSIDCRVIGGI